RSGQSLNAGRTDSMGCRESGDRRSMFLRGRSLQQSDANKTSVEVHVSVICTLKHQRCRNICFWKFVSLHPICKIEVRFRPEFFLSIREYVSYYRLPLWRRVVGQYIELKTLPYLNFRLHLNFLVCSQLVITNAPVSSVASQSFDSTRLPNTSCFFPITQ